MDSQSDDYTWPQVFSQEFLLPVVCMGYYILITAADQNRMVLVPMVTVYTFDNALTDLLSYTLDNAPLTY